MQEQEQGAKAPDKEGMSINSVPICVNLCAEVPQRPHLSCAVDRTHTKDAYKVVVLRGSGRARTF